MNLRIIVLLAAIGVHTQEATMTFDEGLKKAKEEGKILIVDFSHPW